MTFFLTTTSHPIVVSLQEFPRQSCSCSSTIRTAIAFHSNVTLLWNRPPKSLAAMVNRPKKLTSNGTGKTQGQSKNNQTKHEQTANYNDQTHVKQCVCCVEFGAFLFIISLMQHTLVGRVVSMVLGWYTRKNLPTKRHYRHHFHQLICVCASLCECVLKLRA